MTGGDGSGASTHKRIIVLGSGAAGMAAALSAAVAGGDVTVIEASDVIGGTTTLSGGAIWVPANPWAAAEGVADTPAEALQYLQGLDLGDTDAALTEAYAHRAAGAIQGLEQHTSLRWELQPGWPDYHAEREGGKREGRALEIGLTQVPMDVIARVRVDPYRVAPMTVNEERSGQIPDDAERQRREREGLIARGRGLVAALCAAFLDAGGRVVTGVRVDRLTMACGAVVGVEAGGERFEGQVIVTTGGFERNPELTRVFLRGPVLGPAGPPTNQGDGLRMGMSVGAALGNMSEAWWCAALSVPGETIDGAPFYRMLFLDSAKPGGVVVDQSGRRFANEASNYNDFGRALHDVDPATLTYARVPAWLVLDAGRRESPLGPLMPGEPNPAWLEVAPTLEELAHRLEIPPARLGETVDRFNRDADEGVDRDYGRGSFVFDHFSAGTGALGPVRQPPFYALRILPGCLGTKGGLRIDADGRVLRADGRGVIEGLYAAGNAAASPFGMAYPGPGSTIGPALVFGSWAGAAAAASVS